MAWGRTNEQWNHTSSIMALFAAIHSDPDKGSPPSPATFHPYMEAPEERVYSQVPPEVLRALNAQRAAAKGGSRG
jgi:hypothetical protein